MDEIDNLKRQLANSKEETLRRQLENQKNIIHDVEAKLTKKEKKVKELQRKIEKMQTPKGTIEDRLEELEKIVQNFGVGAQLQVGSRITVKGLQSKNEFNGMLGSIIGACNENDRWPVRLENGKELLVLP